VVGAYLGGLACGGIGVGWYHSDQTNVEYYEDFFIFWVCFIIGYNMVRDGLYIIWSAVATSFVLWATDPNCMNIGQPLYFQQIAHAATDIWGTKTVVTWGPEGQIAMTELQQTRVDINSTQSLETSGQTSGQTTHG